MNRLIGEVYSQISKDTLTKLASDLKTNALNTTKMFNATDLEVDEATNNLINDEWKKNIIELATPKNFSKGEIYDKYVDKLVKKCYYKDATKKNNQIKMGDIIGCIPPEYTSDDGNNLFLIVIYVHIDTTDPNKKFITFHDGSYVIINGNDIIKKSKTIENELLKSDYKFQIFLELACKYYGGKTKTKNKRNNKRKSKKSIKSRKNRR
jgi:hypothetical protein